MNSEKFMRTWCAIIGGLTLAALSAASAMAADEAIPAVVIYSKDKALATAKLDDLPLKESVSQYGITWTFEKPARVGQFITGDWYVVGPVTVKAIDPKPLYGAEVPASELDGNAIFEGASVDLSRPVPERIRNGFMLNPPAAKQ